MTGNKNGDERNKPNVAKEKSRINVYDLEGHAKKEIELPKVFSAYVREDLIKRAVLATQSAKRQPYGTNVMAGKRTSAHYHGTRPPVHDAMMNRELSRGPRIHGQGILNLTMRFAPQAVKGRAAHPPKIEKKWKQKINKKEKKLATWCAIASTGNEDIVSKRGHRIGKIKPPIIVEDSIENLKKTKEFRDVLIKLGLGDELKRVAEKKIRSGKGKMRGRRYKKKVGPIIVVSRDNGIFRCAKNLAGVDAVLVKNLCAEYLAPGAHPGRLAIWSESAIKELGKMFGE